LNLTRVPAAEQFGFDWRTFRFPEEPWDFGEEFLKRVFEGRVINSWTAREMTEFRAIISAKRMVCKFVRISRLLPWVCSNFAIPLPLHLIRHPCAVVASQLNYGWNNVKQPDVPEFLMAYPNFVSALKNTNGDEEFLAARWALDQLVPLLWKTPSSLQIVTYEKLILEPERTLSAIASHWSTDSDIESALSQLARPSSVVSASGISGLRGWKKVLSDDQICRILETVKSFGLHFYSTEEVPDMVSLSDIDLASRISQAGFGQCK